MVRSNESKLKPIDHDALFKFTQRTSVLESSIGSSTVAKKNSAATATSTSFKDKSYEVQAKKKILVNEPQ